MSEYSKESGSEHSPNCIDSLRFQMSREKRQHIGKCDSKLSLHYIHSLFLLDHNLDMLLSSPNTFNCHILKDLLSSSIPSMILFYILITKQVKYIMFYITWPSPFNHCLVTLMWHLLM